MPQIFHRSTNTLSRLSIFGAVFLIGALLWVVAEINRSSYVTQAFVAKEQPVQFSHKHHVGDDGIDCRYCHTTVERTASAGMPSTKTCMNCHSQLFANAPYLEPIRESWRTERSLKLVTSVLARAMLAWINCTASRTSSRTSRVSSSRPSAAMIS